MYKSVSRNLALVVRALVLLASCLPFIMASLSAAQVAVNVDATANPHPISPLVYGVAFGSAAQLSDLNAPANRWGGNSTRVTTGRSIAPTPPQIISLRVSAA